MQTYQVELKKNQVLCREGDVETDLFVVTSGELLVCVRKGTQVTAIAKLGPGEYIGELSFFDNRPRGADIIALSDCLLVQIPAVEIRESFPGWMATLGKALALKIRMYDEVIRSKGVKKSNVETIKPLSIEEQRTYYQILSK
jgi:CRP-like cAMP-binding protein